MIIDYEALGLRVKFARIKAKMTQETLANNVDMSVVHISNIETGNTKVSLQTIVNIADVLSVSVDELLCDSVIKSNHVFSKEAQDLLSDCSPREIRVLVDVLKSTKEALRKDDRFKVNMENNE